MIAYSLNGLTVTNSSSSTLTGTYEFSLDASRGSLCAELQTMITDSSAVNNNYAFEGCLYRIRSGSSRFLGDRLVYELEFRKKSNESFPMDAYSDFLSQIFFSIDDSATIAERVRKKEIVLARRSSMNVDKVKGTPSSELWRQSETATTTTVATATKNRPAKKRQGRILSTKKTIGTIATAGKKIKKPEQQRRQNKSVSKLVETRLIKNSRAKRNIVFSDNDKNTDYRLKPSRSESNPPIHTNLIKGLDKINFG